MKNLFFMFCCCLVISCGQKEHKRIINPRYERYRISVAMIDTLVELYRFPEAIKDINMLLNSYPVDGKLYYKKAYCFAQLQIFDSAEQCCLKSIALGIREDFNYQYIASYYSEKKNYKTALLYYDTCLQINHNDIWAKNERLKYLTKMEEEEKRKR